MVPFYISIIFVGIMLILVAFLWIFLDKKRSEDYVKKLNEKREELIRVINDSEQMLNELNKFSDYIVTQVSTKNNEINNTLSLIEGKLQKLNDQVPAATVNCDSAANDLVKKTTRKKIDNTQRVNKQFTQTTVEPTVESQDELETNNENTVHADEKSSTGKVSTRRKSSKAKPDEKIIPINSRHREVMHLAEKGLSCAEIAKALNIGKGEIMLILGINSERLKVANK